MEYFEHYSTLGLKYGDFEGLSSVGVERVINDAADATTVKLYNRCNGRIQDPEYLSGTDEIFAARHVLVQDTLRAEYDKSLVKLLELDAKNSGLLDGRRTTTDQGQGTIPAFMLNAIDRKRTREYIGEETPKKQGLRGLFSAFRGNKPKIDVGNKSINALLDGLSRGDLSQLDTIIKSLDLSSIVGANTVSALRAIGTLEGNNNDVALRISDRLPLDDYVGYSVALELVNNGNAVTTVTNTGEPGTTNADKVFSNVVEGLNPDRDLSRVIVGALIETKSLEGQLAKAWIEGQIDRSGVRREGGGKPGTIPPIIRDLQEAKLVDVNFQVPGLLHVVKPEKPRWNGLIVSTYDQTVEGSSRVVYDVGDPATNILLRDAGSATGFESAVNQLVKNIELDKLLGVKTLEALIEMGHLTGDDNTKALKISEKLKRKDLFSYVASELLINNHNAVTTQEKNQDGSIPRRNADKVFVNIVNCLDPHDKLTEGVHEALAKTGSLNGHVGLGYLQDLSPKDKSVIEIHIAGMGVTD